MIDSEAIAPAHAVTETDILAWMTARLGEVSPVGQNKPLICVTLGAYGRFNISLLVFDGKNHVTGDGQTFAEALAEYIAKTSPATQAARLRAEADKLMAQAAALTATTPPAATDEPTTAAAPCTDGSVPF